MVPWGHKDTVTKNNLSIESHSLFPFAEFCGNSVDFIVGCFNQGSLFGDSIRIGEKGSSCLHGHVMLLSHIITAVFFFSSGDESKFLCP